MNSRITGNIGLGRAIAYYTQNKFIVSIPLNDTQPYDLVIDNGSELKRVSVKYTSQRPRGDVFAVGIKTTGQNSKITKDKPFNPESCEEIFIACSDGTDYIIPVTEIDSTTQIWLGKNKQKYRRV